MMYEFQVQWLPFMFLWIQSLTSTFQRNWLAIAKTKSALDLRKPEPLLKERKAVRPALNPIKHDVAQMNLRLIMMVAFFVAITNQVDSRLGLAATAVNLLHQTDVSNVGTPVTGEEIVWQRTNKQVLVKTAEHVTHQLNSGKKQHGDTGRKSDKIMNMYVLKLM